MTIQAKFKPGMLLKHRIEERYILVCGLGERNARNGFVMDPDDVPIYMTLQLIDGGIRKLNLGINFVDGTYNLIGTA